MLKLQIICREYFMFSIKEITFAATLALSVAIFAPSSASAMNFSAGAASAIPSIDDSNLVQVQYGGRPVRARPGVRPGVRTGVRPSRGGAVIVNRGRNRNVGRGVAAGIGAAAAVGLVGAAIAANSRQSRRYNQYDTQYYQEPVRFQQQCFMREMDLYDRNGVPRGVFPVQVCR
jgi:hypothetical protein